MLVNCCEKLEKCCSEKCAVLQKLDLPSEDCIFFNGSITYARKNITPIKHIYRIFRGLHPDKPYLIHEALGVIQCKNPYHFKAVNAEDFSNFSRINYKYVQERNEKERRENARLKEINDKEMEIDRKNRGVILCICSREIPFNEIGCSIGHAFITHIGVRSISYYDRTYYDIPKHCFEPNPFTSDMFRYDCELLTINRAIFIIKSEFSSEDLEPHWEWFVCPENSKCINPFHVVWPDLIEEYIYTIRDLDESEIQQYHSTFKEAAFKSLITSQLNKKVDKSDELKNVLKFLRYIEEWRTEDN